MGKVGSTLAPAATRENSRASTFVAMHATKMIVCVMVLAGLAAATGEVGESRFEEAYDVPTKVDDDVVSEVTNLLGVDAHADESGIFRRAKNAVKKAAKKAAKGGKAAKKFVSKHISKVLKSLLKKKKAKKAPKKKKSSVAKSIAKSLGGKHAPKKHKSVSGKKLAGAAVAKLEGGLDRRMNRKFNVHSIASKKVTLPTSTKYDNGKIRPPGYVASDARIGANHKYLLGPSRRRIGAGFGRRRAPVKIPRRVKKAVHKDLKKHQITRTFHVHHQPAPVHHVVKKKHVPKAVKRKQIQKITFKSFVKKKKITGIAKFGSYSGVTFYKHCVTHNRWKFGSRKTLKMNFPDVTRAGLKNDDISAMSVPPGWCATVYQHTNYKGKSMKIVGGKNGKNLPCLTMYQMTRHPWPGLKWNDQISSIKTWLCHKDHAPVFPYKGAFCKTTSVRYTTGDEHGANSHMRPKIALMGTKGAAVGVLKHLPVKGQTKMTVIKTDNIGEIQSLRLLATSPDAWYFTDFAVKSCQPGSKWIDFGCTHLWLDGKKISKKEAERRSRAGHSKRENRLTLYRNRYGPCEVMEPEATITVTTGFKDHADSKMKPKVTLYGTKATFTGLLNLPGAKRMTGTTVLKTKKELGRIQRVVLEAMGNDAWLFTKFAVKSSLSWQHFGCTNRWLDGKPYNKTPYGLPYSNKITLHPIEKTCHATFPKSWGKKTKKGCFCNKDAKHGKCSKYSDKAAWCQTRDGCGKNSSKRGGSWDYC